MGTFLLTLFFVAAFMSMITRPDVVLLFLRKWLAFGLAWTGHGLLQFSQWLWPEWK